MQWVWHSGICQIRKRELDRNVDDGLQQDLDSMKERIEVLEKIVTDQRFRLSGENIRPGGAGLTLTVVQPGLAITPLTLPFSGPGGPDSR